MPTDTDINTARHEDELAQLVAAYYRREIGRLMAQAEHWAKNNKPLAVHDRACSADNYFQIVVLMERDVSKGWKRPFDEMRDSLARPPIPEHIGAYPPSAEISAYRDPQHAVAQLTHTLRVTERAPGPTDEEVEAVIKPLWLKTKPSREAQQLRSSLSVAFDDKRFRQWSSDYLPEYIWDLVDIAAQWGLDAGRSGC